MPANLQHVYDAPSDRHQFFARHIHNIFPRKAGFGARRASPDAQIQCSNRQQSTSTWETMMETSISRRHLLQMTAAGIAASGGGALAATSSSSLGAIAASNGFLFGAAAAEVIDSDAMYRDLY